MKYMKKELKISGCWFLDAGCWFNQNESKQATSNQ
jgi:hypothetical protein